MVDNWVVLVGLAGLLNPFALAIGVWMGWRADQGAKIFIAAFAAATLSLLFEAGLGLIGLPKLFPHQVGVLALFPFRFIGAGIVAFIAMKFARRRSMR
ncbi:phosphatidylglycerophosphatase [Rhodobacteraceae bacterium RKSG542]|uniref:phosphatidylglycerophosphatase n=1 Tax=Pseudovibrio flavus TaxID=2529854 RepID=UPI0012BCB1E9|nr:phosphatidylglycerophosphatase [Pseudovibrio flavus]MTI16349.1 phosphatidylglycerophosphatase [Pseudovibrio flavus]